MFLSRHGSCCVDATGVLGVAASSVGCAARGRAQRARNVVFPDFKFACRGWIENQTLYPDLSASRLTVFSVGSVPFAGLCESKHISCESCSSLGTHSFQMTASCADSRSSRAVVAEMLFSWSQNVAVVLSVLPSNIWGNGALFATATFFHRASPLDEAVRS